MSDRSADTGLRPLPSRMIPILAAFDGRVVPARDSSTVVLLRPGGSGTEVYLLRRRRSMEFAAQMHVFPGGGVQQSDRDEDTPWLGPSPARWAAVLGADPALARALVVAAVRELFEETGVLLAGPDPTTVTRPLAAALRIRRDLEGHRTSFAAVLRDHGLAVRSDLLVPWARWITPEFEPLRFDTRFFVGVLPGGQEVGEIAAEADEARWLRLTDVVEQARDGRMTMMPPTLHVCRRVATTAIDGLARVGWDGPIAPVLPRVVEIEGRRYLDAPPLAEL